MGVEVLGGAGYTRVKISVVKERGAWGWGAYFRDLLRGLHRNKT